MNIINRNNVLAKSVCDDAAIVALQKHATFHATFKNLLHMWNHLAWHQVMNWRQPKCFCTILTKNLQQQTYYSIVKYGLTEGYEHAKQ